mgnify:CR=1 FL=1
MALPMPTIADLMPLRPEIFVCGAAFALLMIDLFLSDQRRCRIGSHVHELRVDVDDPRRRGLRRECAIGVVDGRLQARTRGLQFVDPRFEQSHLADLDAGFRAAK